jgi:uncharacterized protein YndB with AHSA1/START domain
MPVSNVTTDADALTMTVVAEFDAAMPRVWQLYADPRQLERWWVPADYPLIIVDHDLSVGGYVRAQVIAPGGEKAHAYWRITAVDAPRSMAWEDGFLNDQGEPDPTMPLNTMLMRLTERAGGGTVMTLVTTFASVESMEMHVAMPLEEQMVQVIDQAEALLSGTWS